MLQQKNADKIAGRNAGGHGFNREPRQRDVRREHPRTDQIIHRMCRQSSERVNLFRHLRMVPDISAAMAAPTRFDTINAVSTGPSSLHIETLTTARRGRVPFSPCETDNTSAPPALCP